MNNFSKRLATCCALFLLPPLHVDAGCRQTENDSEARVVIKQLETAARFRYMDSAPGKVTDRDPYFKLSARLQLNFRNGRTYLQVRGETGSTFSSSWNVAESGDQKHSAAFSVKGLFLANKFGRFAEAQAGGLDFDRGSGTEATSADLDGWLTGYRGTLSPTRSWLPSRVGFTAGYVGDFKVPNFFSRANRMGEINYYQMLVSKKLGNKTDYSGEFDSIRQIRFLRVAAHRRNMRGRILDELTIESIARTSGSIRFGWSTTMSRALDQSRMWRISTTYSDVSGAMFSNGKADVLLNGDSMGLGKRLGVNLRAMPGKNLEIATFISRRLDHSLNGTRWRAQASVRCLLGPLANVLLKKRFGDL